MSTENKRWAKLAGIPEQPKKQQLDENIGGVVSIGAINNLFDREKENYENAFEHFLAEKYDGENLNEMQPLADNHWLDLIKKAFYDGAHAGRTSDRENWTEKWEEFKRQEGLHRYDSLNENLKFNQVKDGKYTANTDFGIFKKGDEVTVVDVDSTGAEITLKLKNKDNKSDSIKGDTGEEVEVFK